MTIQCKDVTQLTQVCAMLVREGVCFKADTDSLVITFTGGF